MRPKQFGDPAPFDLVGNVIAWENGELTDGQAVVFFAYLIRTGTAWSLQGIYGAMADSFIQSGYITKHGLVTAKGQEVIDNG